MSFSFFLFTNFLILPRDRDIAGTFVYAGHQFGTLIALPISGFLAGSSVGWPSVFYLWGTVTIVWSIWWFFFGADSPATHPNISLEEREYIEFSLRTSGDDKVGFTPCFSLFSFLFFLFNSRYRSDFKG